MFGLIGKPLKYVAAAALLVVSGFGVVTFVSAHGGPVASGVIHTCVNNSSGEIKIVDATATCKNNQTALDWNAQGLPGANGTNGTNGADGADGEDGVSGYEIVLADSGLIDVNPNTTPGISVDCPTGKSVVGGGTQVNSDFMVTLESYPLDANTWFARHLNVSGAVINGVLITGYAICATTN